MVDGPAPIRVTVMEPPDWPSLPARPPDFVDGPPATEWFLRIADTLLNRTTLRVGDTANRLTEVEVYYHGPGHEDVFAHRDPVQLHSGRWYFHRTRGSYRGGSFKGVDLSFGDGTAHAGVLFRGLETPDGALVDGPSLLVDHLLRSARFPTVADLDAAIGTRPGWDSESPLRLEPADFPRDSTILRTARVGLSLKFRKPRPGDPALSFVVRPYRYLTEPRRIAKGKPHMVLALHNRGETPEAISRATGCPSATVRRYTAASDSGRSETDPTSFYSKDLNPTEFARLHGYLTGGV